jgi:ElaB/YqjD/DUF883 family membrane-anchored ribosome-binding protein
VSMAMTTAMSGVSDAIKERVQPALDTLEENVRQTRRAIVKGRHAAEDLMDAAQLKVRRNPLAAVSVAAGVGLLAGCAIGIFFGRRSRRP